MTLTAEQKKALQEGIAVRFIEPETGTPCVLIRADMYAGLPQVAGVEEESEIPPGIREAQAALRRDLPALLAEHYDKCALYHGARRLAIARTERELIEECLRRGLKSDEYYIGKIAHYTLADLESEAEIDPSFFEFDQIESAT